MPVDFLRGVRVLEIGESRAAAFAGKLLTDLGAEVWLVERPGRGSLLRRHRPLLLRGTSGLFEFFARGARSVTVDIEHDDGPELVRRLAGLADGVIADRAALLAVERDSALSAGRDGPLARVTVSSRGAPFEAVPAGEFVDYHEGGGGYMTPGRVDDPAREYPLDMAHGGQPGYMGGVSAALALLQALRLARRLGEPVWNDVSNQTAIASMMVLNIPWWEYAGRAPSRIAAEGRPTRAVSGFVRVRDGRVSISMIEEHQWDGLMRALGQPEWTELPVFATQLDRAANWDVLCGFLEEAWREQDADAVMRRCQAEHVPVFAVREMETILASAHEQERGFFSPSEPDGVLLPTNPWVVDGVPVSSSGAAPALGEHTRAALALLGLDEDDYAIFHDVGLV